MYPEPEAWEDELLVDNEKIKMRLDPVREIAKKQYSLEPDMLTGYFASNEGGRPRGSWPSPSP